MEKSTKPASKPKDNPQVQYEKLFLEEKRKNFDMTKCEAWSRLTQKFGQKVSQEELLTIAQIVSHELDIPLAREYKRRKEILVKWFDENLEAVWPFINNKVRVTDQEGERIDNPVV